MRRVDIDDVLALSLPPGVDPLAEGLTARLNQLAVEQMTMQYDNLPSAVLIRGIDWFFTQSPDDVEAFQSSDHCATCRAGNDQIMARLKEFPDTWMALGNLHYTELWREDDDA